MLARYPELKVRQASVPFIRAKAASSSRVDVHVAADQARRTRAHAVARGCGREGSDDLRVVGQAQVIIGGEIDELLPVNGDERVLGRR